MDRKRKWSLITAAIISIILAIIPNILYPNLDYGRVPMLIGNETGSGTIICASTLQHNWTCTFTCHTIGNSTAYEYNSTGRHPIPVTSTSCTVNVPWYYPQSILGDIELAELIALMVGIVGSLALAFVKKRGKKLEMAKTLFLSFLVFGLVGLIVLIIIR